MDRSRPYFGPYLRFGSRHPEEETWSGSVLVVIPPWTSVPPEVIVDVPEQKPEKLKGQLLQTIQEYDFWVFPMVVKLTDVQQEIRYSAGLVKDKGISQHGFFVPKLGKMSHWAAQSCSGYSAHINQAEWGGVAPLWKDLLRRHEENPFHLVLGAGDQIYCDSVFKIPEVAGWLSKVDHGALPDDAGPFTDEMHLAAEKHVLELYLKHFGEEGLRDALARIPHLMMWDDHDIFDGWGSYPDHLQHCSVFQGLYLIQRQFYLLFQHHTTYELTQSAESELFGCGSSFSFLRYIGERTAVVGVDVRGERTTEQVMSPESWDLLFQRMEAVPRSIEHIVIIVSVPIIFPHVPLMESLMQFLAYLNRFSLVHKLLHATGMSRKLMKFNEPEVLDDMWDHFTCTAHLEERRKFVLRLQEYAKEHSTRISFVCGDVHACGAARFSSNRPVEEKYDPRLMTQIITSGIVNAPQSFSILQVCCFFDVDSNVIDANTKEQMIPLFTDYKLKKLMARRNWCEVSEADEEDFEDGLRFTLWTEDPKHKGINLKPYEYLVPPLMDGYNEMSGEDFVQIMEYLWSGYKSESDP